MRRFLRSRLVVLSLACLIGLAGAGLSRASLGMAQSDVIPTAFPVTLNSGECPSPDTTPAYEVGNTVPWGLTETASDQVIAGSVLTAQQVLNVSLENLMLVGQPFTVVVAESAESPSTVVACGDIAGEVVDGQLAVKLAPVGDAGIAGVAVLNRDEQGFLGLGGEEVHVIAYVLTGLGAAPAPATPAADETPAATEPAATEAAATEEPTAEAATPDADCPPASCVTIDLRDIYFDPNVITLPADTPVTVVLTNQGAIVHNFSVTDHNNEGLENLNISETLNPGESKTITINAPAGDYYFFCDQPGHEAAGMRGYLQVKDGAEITTEEATVTPRAG